MRLAARTAAFLLAAAVLCLGSAPFPQSRAATPVPPAFAELRKVSSGRGEPSCGSYTLTAGNERIGPYTRTEMLEHLGLPRQPYHPLMIPRVETDVTLLDRVAAFGLELVDHERSSVFEFSAADGHSTGDTLTVETWLFHRAP